MGVLKVREEKGGFFDKQKGEKVETRRRDAHPRSLFKVYMDLQEEKRTKFEKVDDEKTSWLGCQRGPGTFRKSGAADNP